jgi:GT2 family glycosyltransferase
MAAAEVGAVAIGRNEGERLKRCLRALTSQADAVVYVDSGSTDGSVEFARSIGVEVVSLDMTLPFTAARARNAGAERLMTIHAAARYIQFVDGDCELSEGWIDDAVGAAEEDDEIAAVWGYRSERNPAASVYNRLCAIEWRWNQDYGYVERFGGDALVRAEAFNQVDGFDPALIAGEEGEFCFRLRRAGWRILRLEREMSKHDADMTRFGQFWKRAVRTGHANAEGAWMYGRGPERYCVKPSVGAAVWGAGLPAAMIAAAPFTYGLSFALTGLYGVSTARAYWYYIARGMDRRDAAVYACFCTIGKFPQAMGQAKFFLSKVRRQRSTLIEYK